MRTAVAAVTSGTIEGDRKDSESDVIERYSNNCSNCSIHSHGNNTMSILKRLSGEAKRKKMTDIKRMQNKNLLS